MMPEQLPEEVTIRDWCAINAPFTLDTILDIKGINPNMLRLDSQRSEILKILVRMQLEYADMYMKERVK